MSPDVEKLLKIIEKKLDWGESDKWQSRDFEKLNQIIFDATSVSLSASTLRRIWGHVAYKHLPSTTTLDALSKFAGFETWRSFTKQNIQTDINPVHTKAEVPVLSLKRKNLLRLSWVIMLVIAASLLSIFAVKKTKPPVNAEQYSLSFERMSGDVPNSVIFTYDATSSPTDSVYIQQSWDPSRRVKVDKSLHKQTSIYYDPGFHRAKLIIGDKIVQEKKIIIPTKGWVAMIDHKPIPIYLKPDEFMRNNLLEMPVSEIKKKNILFDPEPPIVKYFNVGNFDSVSVKDFSFSASIKNEYSEGASACQFSGILLITDDSPIIIPISVKGCVSELNMMTADGMISGKKTDLSGFGVDFSNWVNVACKTTADKLQFFVNDKMALELPASKTPANIVGLGYFFGGTGSVKNIRLQSKDKLVFSAF
ncbi:MAG: hypothetical protein JST75_16990 [Bacteroidetes bacterium]|nr:hypothetical protein [Bacteroidota bacterium]